MKIGIIGAGISGMSVARLLKDKFEVEVLEKYNVVGGIARTRDVNGDAYHVNGGHCFNSKFGDVLDFVFNVVLSKDKWNYLPRKAEILFKENWITYPIEFSIKEINNFDPNLAFRITNEMFNASYEKGKNLEEWFINHFGPTLAKEYFIPYNTKIWGIAPKNMDNVWIEDERQMKLPVPTKESFYKSLIDKTTDKMSHASFYYPKSNNQNTFIEAIGEGVDIIINYEVKDVKKESNQWIINGEKKYDLLINTSPLDLIPKILKDIPNNILGYFEKLKFNRVSNVLWKMNSEFIPTWAYIPNKDFKIHRIINTGRFMYPYKNCCITEIIGEHPIEIFEEEGKKIEFLDSIVSHNITEHAYPLFDLNYVKSKKNALEYLNFIGLISHGRFGEWEYYNMDVCIKRSIDLAKKIINEYYHD
ncbi:protoporphyrinogen/coproporphyrinogen oxidase [Campylobacter lari]|uniref:protoporphyrinogen/coproporphyrinogen oxidase n=1 Tax=Campylobacter lari TaxID=201 RepID=UPI0011EB08FB|nr:NAD(P)-binding protein [Campylobacter lari]EAI5067801.1 nucleotidyl-sugar pyranose mutase [Campylobacter jejuni]KAB0590733.1 NAD(P)-binding protein [Campylobacter lari subsp. concheus]MPC00394.1 NAD(P)-binding protein [Campylobacter lari]QEL06421.1 protoporphyrinogen oxidase-like protein [Campylobacter lari subsp. concheus]